MIVPVLEDTLPFTDDEVVGEVAVCLVQVIKTSGIELLMQRVTRSMSGRKMFGSMASWIMFKMVLSKRLTSRKACVFLECSSLASWRTMGSVTLGSMNSLGSTGRT